MKKSLIKIMSLMLVVIFSQILLVSSLTISSTSSFPIEIQPGERVSLTLNIENTLNEDIENVVISLNLNNPTKVIPFAPYQSSNEYTIEEISEGDKEKAKFELISLSDSESGTYVIPVQASYILSDGTRVSAKDIGLVSLIINAKPSIEISLDDEELIKESREELSIKIINSGMGESKFLSIKLKPVNGVKLIGSDKIYIGTIESNDFDNADFQILISEKAISPINFPIELTYTDSRNNQIVENKIISANVYTKEEAIKMGLIQKNNTPIIISGVVLFFIIYLFYKRRKKKRKNKQDNLQ